jgi:inner membrane protein
LGKSNIISLNSSWPHPSFIGAYLPERRSINSNGFDANWELSYFGRSYPQQFSNDQVNDLLKSAIQNSSFGVRFIQPVDAYRQSERSVKYGILFIIFTFMVYFLFELVSRARIHIFQYGLVGVALCTFFLLLISLAEHIGFGYAYILASVLVIAQISLYSLNVIKTLRQTAIVTLVLAALYFYLYIVLQLEDYALLVSSIGLFLTLALVMFAVRNVDWYSEK